MVYGYVQQLFFYLYNCCNRTLFFMCFHCPVGVALTSEQFTWTVCLMTSDQFTWPVRLMTSDQFTCDSCLMTSFNLTRSKPPSTGDIMDERSPVQVTYMAGRQ
uniref:Uncharacterized protein n=1 Tax=Cacopsylla melanoneura TaxID=428564 RepID=A0A8D9AWF7_9HEMI